jgi:hypothetical protein
MNLQINKACFFLPLIFLFVSCANVYTSKDSSIIASEHRIIAIMPPKVSIVAQRNVLPETLIEQQKAESINFQYEMYAWLLKRKQRNQILVEIQDINTTNARLAESGYFEKHLGPEKLFDILQVDGALASNFSMSKPMSVGGAIALGLLFGVMGPTNQVTVNMSLFEAKEKKMFWNFNHTFSGSIGSSPISLVDGLMRQGSRKMPYFSKNSMP